ncbi:hypothetical protein N665_0021s0026 [Sinapis alba]|nr:hypothetical protein N665_0021s0026 [Sinapis alba]
MSRVLVDTESSADIIFKNTLERIEIDLSKIADDLSPLAGLLGEATMTLGSISLAVKARSIMRNLEFLVIDRPASYNVIMGTLWMNSMQDVPSTYHMCLKFPTPLVIETIWGYWKVLQFCFVAELE